MPRKEAVARIVRRREEEVGMACLRQGAAVPAVRAVLVSAAAAAAAAAAAVEVTDRFGEREIGRLGGQVTCLQGG